MKTPAFLILSAASIALAACSPEIIEAAATTDQTSEDSEGGDGDPDPGDGDPGEEGASEDSESGDGDPDPGDGDPDPGDGDPAAKGESLQAHDPNSCQIPLWCVSNVNDPLNSGVASRIGAQACFTSTLTPPLQLLEVNYYVGGKFGQLQDPRLQVYERTNNGPGNSLADVGLKDSNFQIGLNNLILGTPIDLPSAGFCVGFAGGNQSNGSALGLAVDNGSMLVPDQSYITAGQCAGINDWEDVVDLMPSPTGSWCIDALVQVAP